MPPPSPAVVVESTPAGVVRGTVGVLDVGVGVGVGVAVCVGVRCVTEVHARLGGPRAGVTAPRDVDQQRRSGLRLDTVEAEQADARELLGGQVHHVGMAFAKREVDLAAWRDGPRQRLP